ncbi:MAG: YebC/PmpR family DNA-binding transcriptional regulator [Candidatus Gygaella obscura]|nr:YebC/PmpR family DNA-binding transcriptional regulator [Candidatus Gygaella obscura]
MSGHSKWATTKHKKAAADAKRGAMFTKLIKEIVAASRSSGGNSDMNPALRVAMNRAKINNMPKDRIEEAIKRGTGELPGISYEECIYEGYASGGVAILIQTLTDNKNRTSAEIRNLLGKKGGNMAGAGAVAWLFNKKGYLVVERNKISEDELMGIVLDAGAEDLKTEDDTNYEVYTKPEDFENVKKALDEKNIVTSVAEITMIPSNYVKITGNEARSVLLLVQSLEDHDDVQNVYANFDIPDDIIDEVSGN